MNIIKKIAFILVMAMPFSLSSTIVYAEQAASISATSAQTVTLIEKALVEISKSDFSAAQVILKAARTGSDSISSQSEAAKKAHAFLIQGQISAKKGDIAKSTEELNKAIELYKSI